MFSFNLKPVFSFFIKKGLKAKRTKIFLLLSFLPFLILFVVKIIQLLKPDFNIFLYKVFSQAIVPYYFTMFIQFIALFFASSVINDERDNKTLIYLTTTQTPKSSIILGKFFANYLLSLIIILSSFTLSFVLSYLNHFNFDAVKLFLGLIFTACMSTLIYSSFFCFLGTIFKRSVLFGIFFILGWENIIQFFPGSTQKFSINHYVKSLLPVKLPKAGGFLSFNLAPSSNTEAILTITILSILFLIISIYIFNSKEYDLSDQI